MFRKDRTEKMGGGIVIYVKANLDVSLQEELTNSEFRESLWCSIKTGRKRLIVGVCYRSPDSGDDNNDELLKLLDRMNRYYGDSQVLIMGDFNYPGIDYENHSVSSGLDTAAHRFFDKTNDLFLTQYVLESTRIRQGAEPSLLDYVFANEENIVEDMQYDTPLGKSDHVCISWRMITEKKEDDMLTTKRDYWKGNYNKINEELARINWDQDMKDRDVEAKWSYFKNKLEQLANEHVPIKRQPKKQTKEILDHKSYYRTYEKTEQSMEALQRTSRSLQL